MQLIVLLVLTIIYLSSASQPVFVEADSLERDKEGVITATGNVTVEYRGKTLKAQKIIYDTNSKRIEIPSNFYIKTETFEGQADHGWWDIENDEGEAYNVQGVISGMFYVKAGVLKKKRDEYDFRNLEFSSCPFQQRDWYLKTSSGHAREEDKLQVYNPVLKFFDVPVAYTPYLSYPLVDRKTGFLPFAVGRDNYNTLTLKTPFFYVIDDHSDVTVTPDYRNEQGNGASVEYRRLFSDRTSFNLQVDFFREYAGGKWWAGREVSPLTNRWRIKANTTYSPFESWNIYTKVDIPGDRYFFEDFYNSTSLRYTPFTRSYVVARTEYRNLLAEINFDYFYDLTRLDNSQTVQRLPQIRIYSKPRNLIFENLYFDVLSDTNLFYSEKMDRGLRLDNIINFYSYTVLGRFLGTVQLSPRYTVYINTSGSDRTDSRFVVPLKTAVQTNIYRNYGEFTHSVVPRLSFEYVSKLQQSNLPFYDRDDRLGEKRDIDLSVFNLLNFKSAYFLRWELSAGYTFTENFFVGENPHPQHLKPLKSWLMFNLGRMSADSLLLYDLKAGNVIRTVSSLSVNPASQVGYTVSYISDRFTENSKLLSNTLSIKQSNFSVSAGLTNNLSSGFVQRKSLSATWDRRCWNLALMYFEDFNAATKRTLRGGFLVISIAGSGYRLPFIQP